ncbi:FMN-binding protein [Streptacidiphilus sp. 4-A2]|nr:FMN-binding protein [Streptacidiphilus sp. 4-A2]
MRRTVLALAATSAVVALVVGGRAESAGRPRSALADPAVAPARQQAAQPSATPTGKVPGRAPAGTAAKADGSFTGSAVPTQYGTVQVRAVLKGGALTGVQILQQTDGARSSMIDSYALPVLTSEALKAQGADIDVVSGATYTSDGYAQSLQAALDAAGR